MKIKSLLTIALVTSVILVTIADSAEAGRGRGGRGRGSKTNGFFIDYDFKLFTGSDTQLPIIPTSKSISGIDVYTFENAVEDFEADYSRGTRDNFDFSSAEVKAPLPSNFSARYLSGGTAITLPDGNPVIFSVAKGLPYDTDRIEYIFTNSALTAKGISEFTLFIEDTSQYDLLDTEAERTKAITDIEYIIDNGLLKLVENIRISGKSKDDPSKIVSVENSLDLNEENPVSFIPIPTSKTSVPESGNVIALLGLGCLGMSLLVKRKIQHI